MSYFTIMTDSSCDLPVSVAEQMHLRVSPLSVFADGKQYYNFLDGSHIGFEEFYTILKGGALVTTSAVNVSQFKTMMEAELIAGHDVLYIGFSSGLSGTYNSAVQAAAELEGAYPGKKILAFSHGFFCRILQAEIEGVTHRDVTLFDNCEIRKFVI